ncbi:MAG TPA: ferredoxin reductase family protein [Oryzihumus sp.]|nr:ferredoxin reductase family protein [Oryzihumus sp.]
MARRLIRPTAAILYLAVVLVPLGLALRSGPPRAANPAYDVSLASGLVALSLLAVTFILPKRIRSLSSGLGIDVVMNVHRLLGVSALGFVLVHVTSLLLADPANRVLLDPLRGRPAARAAVGGTLALVLLVLTSAWRRRTPGRSHESWRAVHVVLSLAVVLLCGLHVYWLRHLITESAFAEWFTFLLAVVLLVWLRRWVWRPLRALIHPYLVREVRAESPTVTTLVLQPWGHRGLTRFRPGQFAWVRIGRTPLGFDEHPFTISSPPRRTGELEFTVKNLGAHSSAARRVAPGDRVWVDGPHGAFVPAPGRARGMVLIAGGVGITPMMSALRALAADGDERRHVLFVSAGTVEELLFRSEISHIAARLRLRVVELLETPPPGWHGSTGRLTEEVLAAHLPRRRDDLDYFVCGPPGMVRAVHAALERLGVPQAHVHTERYDLV